MQEKSYNVDLIKGFLCICVVIGHCDKTIPNGIIQVIYWFHMPCFFMISGWIMEEPKDISSWLKKRAQRILIPQIVWFLFFFALQQKLNKENIFYFLLGARNIGGVYWFAPVFFVAMIILVITIKKMSSSKLVLFLGILYIFSCFECFFILPIVDKNKISFSIGVVALASIYIIIGYHLKKYTKGKSIPKKICLLSILFLVFLLVVYKLNIYKYNMNMAGIYLGTPILNIIVPLNAWIIILYCSRNIKLPKIFVTIIEKFGKNSLLVMYIHKFILNEVLEPFFGVEGFIWILNSSLTLIISYLVCAIVNQSTFFSKCLGGEICHEKKKNVANCSASR